MLYLLWMPLKRECTFACYININAWDILIYITVVVAITTISKIKYIYIYMHIYINIYIYIYIYISIIISCVLLNLNICLVHVRLTLFCLYSLWQPLFRLQPHATNSNMCFMYHISVDQWGNHCIPSTSIPIHSDTGRLGMILNMTSFIVLRCSRNML